MQYFLTGATGFIGGRLARQLIEAGHQVKAMVRDPARAGALAELGAQLYQGDVTEKDSMRTAMAGCDGVFHVAGWYKIGTRDKANGELVNVLGTRNVLDLMKELGIPKESTPARWRSTRIRAAGWWTRPTATQARTSANTTAARQPRMPSPRR